MLSPVIGFEGIEFLQTLKQLLVFFYISNTAVRFPFLSTTKRSWMALIQTSPMNSSLIG